MNRKHCLLLTDYRPCGNMSSLIKFFQALDVSVLLYDLHHLDSNETLGEKAKLKIHNAAPCCFEQILETVPYKTVIRPFASHPTNLPRKAGTTLQGKKGGTHKQRSLMGSDTWIQKYWPTTKNVHLSALCRHWMSSRELIENDD